MVSKLYDVKWTIRSQQHIGQAYDYISKDSVQNAVMVLEDIVKAINKVNANPEFYGPDKYKQNNDGSPGLLKNIIIG